MKILVTGASGFIGSALVPSLAARGHEVRSLKRGEAFEPLLRGTDAVVHLANIAHARAPAGILRRVNAEGTSALAEQAAAAKVGRFVYLSSIKASGERTSDRPFDGGETPRPQDVYGEAKLAAERSLGEIGRRTGLATTVLRPPLVYGPGVKANFLALIRAVDAGWPLPFAGVRNRRSLIYVGNLADAIGRCLESPRAQGRTYVVSDGAPVSTPELCLAIGRALSRPARLFSFPQAALRLVPKARALLESLEVDASALRTELQWMPPFTFEEGLRATARWYRECQPRAR